MVQVSIEGKSEGFQAAAAATSSKLKVDRLSLSQSLLRMKTSRIRLLRVLIRAAIGSVQRPARQARARCAAVW